MTTIADVSNINVYALIKKPVFSCYQNRTITPETRFPETDFGFSVCF